MDRRNFLRDIGTTVASGVALGVRAKASIAAEHNHTSQPTQRTAAQSASQPTIAWRMATSWSESLDILLGAGQLLGTRVAAMTGGRFTIEVFPADTIVPALEVFDAVSKGTVECAHTASFYAIDKNEALSIATGLPFGLTPQQQNAWLYYGGGLEAIQKVYSDFGIISFPAGGTGTQMGGWLRKEIHTLNDLQGFKFRIPGMGGKVMQALGVQTIVVPSNHIADALKSGEIDGAEWIGPHDDEKLGLHKAAPFYYYPGWWEPGSTLDIIINKQSWDTLPKTYQAILKTACYQVNIATLSHYEVQNQAALVRMVASGTQLRPYSQEIMTAAKDTAFALYDDTARNNPSFKELFDQWKDFRRQIYQWNRFNELSFATFTTENL